MPHLDPVRDDLIAYKDILVTLNGQPDLQSIAKNAFRNSLIVKLVGIGEKTIDDTCTNYVKASANILLHDFLLARIGKMSRGYGKTELADTLKLLGRHKNDHFTAALTDNEITTYGNYVANRHLVAHKNQSPTITFEEIERTLNVYEKVLDQFCIAITVPLP